MPRSPTALLASGLALLLACSKGADSKRSATTAAPAPPPPAPVTATASAAAPATAAPADVDVPFKGSYTKYAETAFRNGRRVRTANATGAATLVIASGKATFAQTYNARGKVAHVTQVYTFGPDGVKAVPGGFDVTLVWQSMDADTKSYSPDRNRPLLEVRKQASGWEIGLVTTDNNGIMGGVEFR
jgi:hypothetical protein